MPSTVPRRPAAGLQTDAGDPEPPPLGAVLSARTLCLPLPGPSHNAMLTPSALRTAPRYARSVLFACPFCREMFAEDEQNL